MRDMMRTAARMGVRVHVAHIDDDPELLGYYSHESRIIVLRFELTPSEMRSVLAHELAHAFYGDVDTTPALERRADKYAAALLIRADEYAAAEAIDPSSAAIAEELRVTSELVDVYKAHCLQRLGNRTYGRSWDVGISMDMARQLSS